MSAPGLSSADRAIVYARACGYCEYCRVHEDSVFFPHEADHVIAEQHGGAAGLANLALACFHCNRFKGPNIASVDPVTKQIVPLFHPRQDRWTDHFRLDDSRIIPVTAVARATVFLLRVNDPDRVRARGSWRRKREAAEDNPTV